MFDLAFERGADEEAAQIAGVMVIGEHREAFTASLSAWGREDYRASWARTCAHVERWGYGRFLLSVEPPGVGLYTAWRCFVRGEAAELHKMILLPSATDRYKSPADGEDVAEDYVARHESRSSLIVHRCTLADIVHFEKRVRGAGWQ